MTPNEIFSAISAWWQKHQPLSTLMNTDLETAVEMVFLSVFGIALIIAVIGLPFAVAHRAIQFRDWLRSRDADP